MSNIRLQSRRIGKSNRTCRGDAIVEVVCSVGSTKNHITRMLMSMSIDGCIGREPLKDPYWKNRAKET